MARPKSTSSDEQRTILASSSLFPWSDSLRFKLVSSMLSRLMSSSKEGECRSPCRIQMKVLNLRRRPLSTLCRTTVSEGASSRFSNSENLICCLQIGMDVHAFSHSKSLPLVQYNHLVCNGVSLIIGFETSPSQPRVIEMLNV